MSLKAGRVGVNPADVNPINGHIEPESIDSYTKAQADAKFETQIHAASAYETQTAAASEHALLQPKTLAVPISMLSGSKLTVESALQGLNDSTNEEYLDFTTEYTDKLENYYNKVVKKGNFVIVTFSFENISVDAYGTILTVPASCKPSNAINCFLLVSNSSIAAGYIDTNGDIKTRINISNAVIRGYVAYPIV